jgi:hypothetical protein
VTYASNTNVSTDSSRAEIERTLRRYKATAFAYGWTDTAATVMFEIAGRRIRFVLPMPDPNDPRFTMTPSGKQRRSPEAAEREWEQAQRQRWRALALVIKAKLEAVEAGISTVEAEFLSNVMLPNGATVGEWAAPQLAIAYEQSTMPALMPGASE